MKYLRDVSRVMGKFSRRIIERLGWIDARSAGAIVQFPWGEFGRKYAGFAR